MAEQPRANFRQIHELLAECVRNDPGNALYFDELLANLKRRSARRIGWWRRIFGGIGRGRRTEAHTIDKPPGGMSESQRLLQSSPQLVWNDSENPLLFRRLAAAAGDCEFDEVELRLLAEARQLVPDDTETLRQVAQALSRQGQFEEAVGPWHAVAALAPGDPEALQAIDDLSVAVRAEEMSTGSGELLCESREGQSLLSLARKSHEAGKLEQAEALYAQAQAARGADLGLVAERQRIRLAQSQQRVVVARRRAEHDAHPRAQDLVKRLEQDHIRLEIELLAMRAEQLPTDVGVRIELGRLLKQAGNYSGAVAVLEEAVRLDPRCAAGLIEWGECRQYLRQFEDALACYQRAVEAADTESGEVRLLARYRAGVLAAAMGRVKLARGHFEEIVAVSPEYRDVRKRLEMWGTSGLNVNSASSHGAGPTGPEGPASST